MVSPILDMPGVRAAVERIVDELGLDAFVYTVEPREAGWELRVECAIEEGWQVITLPVDPGKLVASLSDAGAREELRAAWFPHFRACIKSGPLRAPGTDAAMTPHWEHFPHEADMGVRGFGATKAVAFEQAALAMTAVIADLAAVTPRDAVRIQCGAPDDELLLAEWLNSVIYEMATRKMLFSRFAVRLDGTWLTAEAWGERIDVARHHPAVEIKGATFTALRVAPKDGGWVAQTVVDV